MTDWALGFVAGSGFGCIPTLAAFLIGRRHAR